MTFFEALFISISLLGVYEVARIATTIEKFVRKIELEFDIARKQNR